MKIFPEAEIKEASIPYTSLNGNMFSILKEVRVGLRLSEEDREDFILKFKSELFETYGAVMKEYVTISSSLLKNTKPLTPSVKKSYEYIKTLKAKPTKGK